MHASILPAAALVATALASSPALADECAPTDTVDPLRLLRQTSLDVRGTIPTFEEYERVRAADDRAAEVEVVIAEMFDSGAYRRTIREYHQSLLWATMDESILSSIPGAQAGLRRDDGLWSTPNKARVYRGLQGTMCVDQEQTEFDAEGRPVPIETFSNPACNDGTCQREGWLWVEPYWAPGTEVKVCAYDAQTLEVGENGQSCDLYSVNDERCGCGENLRRCGLTTSDGERPARDALAEEPLRIFEWIVTEDRSYLEAFSTSTSFVNGPSAHFYNWLSGVQDEERRNGIVSYDPAFADVPDLDFTDETWTQVEREGGHSGVLTTMAYLIRFASNRARANRFYTAFYCDPFVPPEGGIPAEEGEPPANLRERDGCDGCHEVLEPAAAHWGRWRTNGTFGLLRQDLVDFETPRENCAECSEDDGPNCSQFCQAYYITADNAHPDEYAQFGGLPQAAAWLTAEERGALETGPSALLDEPLEQRRIAQCTVRNLATHLYGRELETGDLQWLDAQTEALMASGFSFNGLFQTLLADPRYRAID